MSADDIWRDQAHAEWALWQKVCRCLEHSGAVTILDLNMPVGAEPKTDGMRLLKLIREWGEARATLAIAYAARVKEKSDG